MLYRLKQIVKDIIPVRDGAAILMFQLLFIVSRSAISESVGKISSVYSRFWKMCERL